MAEFDYYNWVILPLIIFASRVCDVTLGTLRHVMTSRGQKNIAPFLGFFEVLIWILVVKEIMNQANNYPSYIAWAAGFATGNYIGLRIEERIAMGMQIIRIITNLECGQLIQELRNNQHGTTVVDAQGAKGSVKIIFTIVKRKNIDSVVKIVNRCAPDAFYTIEDIRDVNKGIFTSGNRSLLQKMFPSQKI